MERSAFGTLSHAITALTNVVFPFTGNNLHGLVGNIIDKQAKNKFKKKISEKRAVRPRKGFTVFILNDTLIDGITETVKHEITKTRKWISFSFGRTFSHLIRAISNFFSSKRHEWNKELEEQQDDIWIKTFSSASSFKRYQDY